MNDAIKQAEDMTGLDRKQLASYGLYAGIGLVVLGIGNVYITTLIGVVYPVLASILALNSKGSDDDQQWLTYWVCYGVFSIIDQFAGIILSFIPFYFFLKLIFLVYLFHPSWQGAKQVYESYLRGYVKQYRSQLEAYEKQVGEKIASAQSVAGEALSGGN
jgi:receptor expression-enhancing protein 5/6